ncbi:FAD-dependent monooxygenase [Streptomyces sp. NBC_00233]|uniref:FAD-dependent monooxygenase n=1 Tax=Streptomyces sp. NBC_00233 TaxID=2975686 RepID=UPI002252EBDE|nr:FAD-dependent monooxygenase [Streptomyces sp. NBC_00233]MCX5230635.1 FAD-dependent monooxygenase [Streptomyces sp. NBC_00233]
MPECNDTGSGAAGALDTAVTVIGAGPVGLALALDLARRGVPVRVVERDERRFQGSRAKGIQPRTLEVLDDLGLAAAARAAGGAYPPMGLHVGPFTKAWQMHATAPDSIGTPYPDVLLLPQYATTALLHDAVERLGVRVDFGARAVEITQDEEACTVRLEDGRMLASRYVVGADGGSSTVRKAAGIAFEGTTDETDRMILVDATVDGLSHDHWHIWPRLRGRSIAACPLPGEDGRFQIMIKIRADDPVDLTGPALATLLRRRAGTSLTLRDITWSSVFRPNIRLAERYRNGRLLLCGDAAHVHTPAGAQGLNTGVQDAHNLGWKLQQVLAGADDVLLDSYELERRPVAAQVLGRSTELYEGLRRTRPSGLTRGPDEHQLGISYFGGPLAPADAPCTANLRCGDRAPDAPLPEAMRRSGSTGTTGATHTTATPGSASRLFDLYRGPHFTALAFGAGAATALDRLPWPTGGVPLHRHAVLTHTPPRTPDETALLAAYGITEDTVVLIRPDGYIGDIMHTAEAADDDNGPAGRATSPGASAIARLAPV